MHRGSSRKLEGNLCDLSVQRLVEICRHHSVTGVLRITSWGYSAMVQFDHGQVGAVKFRAFEGERAMSELLALRDGIFELVSATPISLDAPTASEHRSVDPIEAAHPAQADAPVTLEPEVMTHRPDIVASPPMPHAPMALAGAAEPHAPMALAGATEHPSQPAWPQPAWPQPAWPGVANQKVPVLLRRLPPLGPALGFGLLGFMLLIMVAIQL